MHGGSQHHEEVLSNCLYYVFFLVLLGVIWQEVGQQHGIVYGESLASCMFIS